MPEDPTVYIAHCIDAEGPLYESIEATFERIDQIFGISLPPSRKTLRRLQNGEVDLGGLEEAVARVLAPELLEYNDSWDKIDAMLERIGSDKFRRALLDSEGGGWVYNWHCTDHIGYTVNPRRKAEGYHVIFDHYRRFIDQTGAPDGLHWHFHPTHPLGCSHLNATFCLRNPGFFDILARRVIDRDWFPSVNRAGCHTERPDSHWLLEQWIPFDISNQGVDDDVKEVDLSEGRFGDWRRAPKDWSVYHPAHDDYQAPGNCRRYIARCLNVGTRLRVLGETEMRKAFERALRHGATLFGITDHDFRDIGRDVDYVRELLRKVTPDFPGVRFRYAEAREAMSRVLFGRYKEPEASILSVEIKPGPKPDMNIMTVSADEETFGPQPFLAVRTRSGGYYYDNMDFQEPFRRWTYTFDPVTFPLETVESIGVATNDRRGFPHVRKIIPADLDVQVHTEAP